MKYGNMNMVSFKLVCLQGILIYISAGEKTALLFQKSYKWENKIGGLWNKKFIEE